MTQREFLNFSPHKNWRAVAGDGAPSRPSHTRFDFKHLGQPAATNSCSYIEVFFETIFVSIIKSPSKLALSSRLSFLMECLDRPTVSPFLNNKRKIVEGLYSRTEFLSVTLCVAAYAAKKVYNERMRAASTIEMYYVVQKGKVLIQSASNLGNCRGLSLSLSNAILQRDSPDQDLPHSHPLFIYSLGSYGWP